MSLVPEDLRQEFMNVVDWLKEKAVRKEVRPGTRLPWDKDWIIESLSDSTIYMAYYTISKIINERGIDAALLDDAAFDYVFLGKGNAANLKVGRDAAEAMRREFTYFYPLDSRHSGRDSCRTTSRSSSSTTLPYSRRILGRGRSRSTAACSWTARRCRSRWQHNPAQEGDKDLRGGHAQGLHTIRL
jgi:hypothetical protein